MMADQLMTARRQIRLAVLKALQGAKISATVLTPGDWETPQAKLPTVLMRAPTERKEGLMAGQGSFITAITVELEARVEASSAEAAQDAIEALGYVIECAVLTNYELIRITQKVMSVDTIVDITADSRRHLGGAMMTFVFEVVEVFDPVYQSPIQPIAYPLLEVQLHASSPDGALDIILSQ